MNANLQLLCRSKLFHLYSIPILLQSLVLLAEAFVTKLLLFELLLTFLRGLVGLRMLLNMVVHAC